MWIRFLFNREMEVKWTCLYPKAFLSSSGKKTMTLSSFLILIFRNMDSDTLPAFLNDLTCSVCMNYFLDPVTIDCGHSFCRLCLDLCWEEAQTPMRCPECRGVSERPDFKTNIALRNLASIAREARAHNVNSSEGQICVAHKEAKELFCRAEKKLLCALCSESPEHASHSHSPVQWSAEEYRVGVM